jgi:hypothetical protein
MQIKTFGRVTSPGHAIKISVPAVVGDSIAGVSHAGTWPLGEPAEER